MKAVEGWQKGRLGELCSIEIGGTPSRSNPDLWDASKETLNLWVSIRDLNRTVITDTAEHISDSGVKHSNVKLQNSGTVLLSFKLSIGRVAFAGVPLYTNEAIAGLNSNKIDLNYLFHGLNHWALLKDVDQAIKGATLNKEKLKKITFEYPKSITEQTKIAEILSTVDRAIEQTEALIDKQQRIKTGLMQDLLTRGIDEHGNLRSEQTHEFKDSPLGRIPMEWEVNPLSDLADVDRGKFTHRPRNDPRFYGGEYPFIQTGDVTSHIGRKVVSYTQTLNKRGTKVSKEFPRGTIAITIAANIADTAILGTPMFFPDSVVGAVVALPNNTRFVELMIRQWKPILEGLAPQSAQKNINLEVLRPLPIPTPIPEEQQRIGDLYDSLDFDQERMELTHIKLRSLKTALMQDLLTGKKRVTALLNDTEVVHG